MPKLLTIDDENEFTELIRCYFEPRGYEVLVAHNGTRGLVLARTQLPQVCLIDLKMPGLHGDEVLKEILALKAGVQCIMITASEGEGKTRADLMQQGAFGCFDKPLTSLKDLKQKIKEALT